MGKNQLPDGVWPGRDSWSREKIRTRREEQGLSVHQEMISYVRLTITDTLIEHGIIRYWEGNDLQQLPRIRWRLPKRHHR